MHSRDRASNSHIKANSVLKACQADMAYMYVRRGKHWQYIITHTLHTYAQNLRIYIHVLTRHLFLIFRRLCHLVTVECIDTFHITTGANSRTDGGSGHVKEVLGVLHRRRHVQDWHLLGDFLRERGLEGADEFLLLLGTCFYRSR